ncbi:DUF2207 domain-containing protein, partial [Candidatus Dojkabacteria bacterium]|nr:DUF2207 domain-containing protein [Candidatus Dojkabacteria bacterium]
TYYWQYKGKTLSLTSENLLPFEEFTVLTKIPRGTVDNYASINLELSPSTQRVYYNGIDLGEVSDKIAGFPTGRAELLFTADGYESEAVVIDLVAGEETDLTVDLSPSTATMLIWAAIGFCNVIGCLLLPGGLLWIYFKWRTAGKDKGRRETIIPIYNPPDDIRPYLLGSLKDEKVDTVDITSTIIDLAYRGYLKIREFEEKKVLGIKLKNKDFEIIKVKDFADLPATEKRIIDDIMGGKDRVTTTSLKNKFYTKVPGIRKAVYNEMVEKKYFESSPDKVRTKYIAISVLLIVVGVGSIMVNIFLPLFITASGSAIMLGIVGLFVSGAMPAKTEIGGKVFDQVLGFKMYMETAEKYRVQNLTPETFEKFLSYAIVFGIEKSWAEKFKDIYQGQPDWYEGTGNNWNAIYLADALSDFNSTTSSSLTSAPSSSGSSGGGWSGGGGFSGGFSGGGGGGGGGGAW